MSDNSSTDNIQHLWTLACENSSIDRDSNNVSLFNILEQVILNENQVKNAKVKQQRSDITVPVKFQLVSLWHRLEMNEEEEIETGLEFLSPEGVSLLSRKMVIKFGSGKKRFRFRAKFEGLKITTVGLYHFRFSKVLPDGQWQEITRVPLEIKTVKKTADAPADKNQ